VETSLRDALNLGYDVVLFSDTTASGKEMHYDTTLERISNYYGIVVDLDNLKKMLETLGQISDGHIKYDIGADERIIAFLEKHNLIDLRKVKRVLKRSQDDVSSLLFSNTSDLKQHQLVPLDFHLIFNII
jgi:ureidoacrylate peracid hydrolase